MKTQITIVKGEITSENFWKAKGYTLINKPEMGGLWTSSLKENGRSDWEDFYETSGLEKDAQDRYAITVSDEARVLIIDSKEDYKKAIDKYGKFIPEGSLMRMSLFGREPYLLNYDDIQKDYDALNVTRKGLYENREEFYGWDVESTVWFNLGVFEEIKTA